MSRLDLSEIFFLFLLEPNGKQRKEMRKQYHSERFRIAEGMETVELHVLFQAKV